jgi:hypothetical protein
MSSARHGRRRSFGRLIVLQAAQYRLTHDHNNAEHADIAENACFVNAPTLETTCVDGTVARIPAEVRPTEIA